MRCSVFVLLSWCAFAAAADPAEQWAQWRGPLGTGTAPHADPPEEWDSETNVRWKTKIPGLGHSTPVVWDDRIFLTTAIPYGEMLEPRYSTAPGSHDNLPVTRRQEFAVLAVSREDGAILWQTTVNKALPHDAGHRTNSLASASPVTDGEHVFAHFGTYGLYCLDLDGQVVWSKNFGRMDTLHGHGEGSSPALYRDTLVVNWDHEGESFIVALDKATGEERWREGRDEVTSWSSPIVVEHDGRAQVVVAGTGRVRGYDLATGGVIWECGGLSSNVVASPVAGDGVVYLGSSYDIRSMMAIRLDGAEGDITDTDNVLWKRSRGTPYVPSPLLVGDTLYVLHHYQGMMSRIDAKTGEDRGGPYRLPGVRDVYASPVAAAGKIYITGRDGMTLVFRHEAEGDAEPEILAANRLGETVNASVALAGSEVFIRGEEHLYCIAEE